MLRFAGVTKSGLPLIMTHSDGDIDCPSPCACDRGGFFFPTDRSGAATDSRRPGNWLRASRVYSRKSVIT